MTTETRNLSGVDLYMSLFRGREDVYARRWENRRKRKAGYMPVRAEDGEYEPLTKVALIDRHLHGDETLGIYPLLPDHSTWFLAFDFDGPRAFEEAQELLAVCEVQEIHAYLERSRSGNFHLWLFFTAPIEAWKTRRVGFELLKEAGLVGGDVNVDVAAFDRMFPSQDHLSGKGLGNLIALPLQFESVMTRRTEFLDPVNDFDPFVNQWAFLRTIQRISEKQLLGTDLMADVELVAPAPPPVRRHPDKWTEILQKMHARTDEQNRAGVERVVAACRFMQHCKADAATLPEKDWWSMASVLAAFGEPGREAFHELSTNYPGYDRRAADEKLDRQLENPMPHTCAFIRQQVWDCGTSCGVRSPCALPFRREEQADGTVGAER